MDVLWQICNNTYVPQYMCAANKDDNIARGQHCMVEIFRVADVAGWQHISLATIHVHTLTRWGIACLHRECVDIIAC